MLETGYSVLLGSHKALLIEVAYKHAMLPVILCILYCFVLSCQ
jgi:hypothetical protein